MKNHNKAFTLTEMSIVILIISIIVSGVTIGDYIIQKSKIRSLINEYGLYDSATTTYRQLYQALPGDNPKATSYWSAQTNGDGNLKIEISNGSAVAESEYGVQQLYLAQLITRGLNSTSTSLYLPSKLAAYNATNTNGGGFIYSYFSGVYNQSANSFLVRYLSTQDSYEFDLKMDDGIPYTGIVLTVRPPGGAARCVSAASSAATATYNLTETATIDCQVYVYLTTQN